MPDLFDDIENLVMEQRCLELALWDAMRYAANFESDCTHLEPLCRIIYENSEKLYEIISGLEFQKLAIT